MATKKIQEMKSFTMITDSIAINVFNLNGIEYHGGYFVFRTPAYSYNIDEGELTKEAIQLFGLERFL